MGSSRRDLLSECNQKGAPLDLFASECCRLCINPECTRSQFGQSRFDSRVKNWHERLFENVPRMTAQDPRFALFAGKKFLTLDVSHPLVVTSSAWMDPRDLEEPPMPLPPPTTEPSGAITAVDLPPIVVPEPASDAPKPIDVPSRSLPPPALTRKALPSHMILANTAPQQGQMLAGRTPSVAPDKWSGPVSTAPATGASEIPTVVVKPGSRVTIKGSGV